MKNFRLPVISATLVILLLSGCAGQQPVNQSPVIAPEELTDCDRVVLQNLEDAVKKSGADLNQLRRLKQADPAWKGSFSSAPPPPKSLMRKPVTMSWQGPIEDILQSIAATGKYTLKITGKQPPQPVIVNVNVKSEPLYLVLEDIGWQAGQNVAVVRNDVNGTIKLVYRKD